MKPLLLLMFGVSLAVAADDSNTVNERIVVSGRAMESHWGLNCTESWARFTELEKQPGSCAPSPVLRRQLELCGFIYQPPGQMADYSGPDYRSAARKRGCEASLKPCPPGGEERCR